MRRLKIENVKEELNSFFKGSARLHGKFSIMEKKKKLNRFNGLSEEEVAKNTLPDYLKPDLDLVFLGINPSLMAAYKGRYYAGPGNHFYKLLHAAELVPRFVSFEEDGNLLQYNIGLTNIVTRATRSSADLTTTEIKKGCAIVVEKMKHFKPKIAIFNGKCIYQPFAQQFGKSDFHFGLQTEKIGSTAIWVVPSSSARCSNFPRMEDKLHFYRALKRHLMFLKGEIANINPKEFVFENKPREKASQASKLLRKSPSSCNVEEPQFVIMEILGGSPKHEDQTLETDSVHFAKERKSSSPSSLHFSTANGGGEAGQSIKPSRAAGRESEENKKLISEIESSSGNLDFMNLIKRRILEKRENTIDEENELKSVKKSKYAHLRSRKK